MAQHTQREVWQARALQLLAVLPLIGMLVEVARAPRMHFLDYWTFLVQATKPDGSLDLAGLFAYHNGHPMIIPRLLFWLDAKYLGGSNQVFGLLTVLLSAITVLVLHRLLPAGLSPVRRAALLAAFSFLFFAPSMLDLYGIGMSGVSWLPALLAGVLALVAARAGRTWTALALGLLACLCHGTAFALWPALALVAWLRGDRRWRTVLPLAIGVVVVMFWLVTAESDASPPAASRIGPDSYVGVFASLLGQLWSPHVDGLAYLTGALTAAGLVLVLVTAIRTRREPGTDPALPALALFTLLVAVMIAYTRTSAGNTIGLSPRYAGISALAICVLLAVLLPRLLPGALTAVCLTVALVTYAVAPGKATQIRDSYTEQAVLAVAMRVGAVQTYESSQSVPRAVLPRLTALGTYPFSPDFTLGCGLPVELGSTVDLAAIPVLPGPPGAGGSAGNVETPVRGDTVISGWAVVEGRRADCVLVADRDGRIVGGGAVGIGRPDLLTTLRVPEARGGWHAVAKPDLTEGRILVVARGKIHQVPGGGK
ncbi:MULTISPECIES: DUF2079 domain-containing protein [unclassified Crossiella]|uniref:DUF2079 domain-containing protein n=1 Tax=unclassified Crossiella TaxID=2620835 RepID=UPI001FFF258E|nr:MULTISPECIES: DUF2079 domain-containing protein [unclassified Crossiella]MCK2237835.1 DUF2079 domain-containing protein [Crossiella sp. S99.2]MCK2255121.1 DUF2079 domain-containing protein [Crossiella sp. S99.1]